MSDFCLKACMNYDIWDGDQVKNYMLKNVWYVFNINKWSVRECMNLK
jgi:hypothetical protein